VVGFRIERVMRWEREKIQRHRNEYVFGLS